MTARLVRELVRRLKGPALESLLHDGPMTEGRRRMIIEIARLREDGPWFSEEVRHLCDRCVGGDLERVFQVAEIGELARALRDRLDEDGAALAPGESLAESPPDSIPGILLENNALLRNLWFSTAALVRQSDLNLKGRCPSCDGDLVEIIDNSKLYLRCHQQLSSECRKTRWYVQDVKRQ